MANMSQNEVAFFGSTSYTGCLWCYKWGGLILSLWKQTGPPHFESPKYLLSGCPFGKGSSSWVGFEKTIQSLDTYCVLLLKLYRVQVFTDRKEFIHRVLMKNDWQHLGHVATSTKMPWRGEWARGVQVSVSQLFGLPGLSWILFE